MLAIISFGVNLLLTAAKLITGILSRSVALTAEAIHSFFDLLSSLIAFWGIKLGEKPPDAEHPYGHERFEGLAGFSVAFLLAISGGLILAEAIQALVSDHKPAFFSPPGIVIMAIAAVVNALFSQIKLYYGNRFASPALLADAEHTKVDAISSVVVLAGLFLVKFNPATDNFLGIALAVYIFYEAFQLGRETIDTLVDTANPTLEASIKVWLGSHHHSFSKIRTRKVGPVNMAEITLLGDPEAKLSEITSLTQKLSRELVAAIPQLKQVSVTVESHQYTANTVRSGYKKHLFYGRRHQRLGPAKQGTRIIIPIYNDEIAPDFGAAEYLVIDINNESRLIQKKLLANPYYGTDAPHGAQFASSVIADRVYIKQIAAGARQNLENRGIIVQQIGSEEQLKDLMDKLFGDG